MGGQAWIQIWFHCGDLDWDLELCALRSVRRAWCHCWISPCWPPAFLTDLKHYKSSHTTTKYSCTKYSSVCFVATRYCSFIQDPGVGRGWRTCAVIPVGYHRAVTGNPGSMDSGNRSLESLCGQVDCSSGWFCQIRDGISAMVSDSS